MTSDGDTMRPIFQEPPDGLDSDWRHGALLVGLGQRAQMEPIELAQSFHDAAKHLLDRALRDGLGWEAVHPIVYQYRHALELYLKAILPPDKRNHDIGRLRQRLKDLLQGRYRSDHIARLLGYIEEFERIDPSSTVFRYAEPAAAVYARHQAPSPPCEIWVDFRHLEQTMDAVFWALHHVWLRGLPEQGARP